MSGAWPRVERLVRIAMVAAIAIAFALVLQKSFHFLGTGPFLNVDDSIPNVAVALNEHGRYGFLASPAQAYNDVERAHAFFNYGPLYFWIAALFSWLFGPSLLLFRMLHPIGLVAIAAMFLWSFRKQPLAGAAALVVLVDLYFNSHWPIARPDIIVAVCAVLFFLSSAAAIERGRPAFWLAAGFFAGCAVTSHQIAAGVAMAAMLTWAWSLWVERLRADLRRYAVLSGAAVVTGGAAAALLYLAAIDFRIRDVWTMGSGGMQALHRPYMVALQDHFYYAWSSLPPTPFRVLAGAFGAAAVLALAAPWLPGPWQRPVAGRVLPPVLVAIVYQVTLGFYGNSHTGYAILSQVAVVWAIAAAASVTMSQVRDGFARQGPVIAATVSMLAVVFVLRADARWLAATTQWQLRSEGNVAIADYVNQVISRFPERARVWGSLYFGLTAGDRTDLIQYKQGLELVEADFLPEAKAALAPDFLALGPYEIDVAGVLVVANLDFGLERFAHEFPGERYRPVRLVSAPPYGVTANYERVAAGTAEIEDPMPEVAVNDGTGRRWSGALTAPIDVAFTPAASVAVDVSANGVHGQRASESSLSAHLAPGTYLIEVALERASRDRVGVVMATPGRRFYWRSGWADFSLPAAPYLPGATRAWVLADHLGGELYLSRFELGEAPALAGAAASGMRVASVRRVATMVDTSGRIDAIAVPAWKDWTHYAKSASIVAAADGGAQLSGVVPPNMPIFESPAIAVPQNRRVVLTLPTSPSSGTVKVSVTAVGGSALTPLTLMPRRVVFHTGNATAITIMIVNSELEEPLDVRLGPARLAPAAASLQYVDILMRCRSPYITLDKSDCARIQD